MPKLLDRVRRLSRLRHYGRRVKTDKRDDRTLCEARRLGAYRHAHRTSDRQRHVRAQFAVREAMVRTRSRYISLIGALLRRDGFRVPSGAARNFLARPEAMELTASLLDEAAPLLGLMRALNEQVKRAEERLAEVVKGDEAVARLCTAPGVGRVTAASFAATLDDVPRFSDAKQARAYLGLVPSEYSSGQRQQRGGVSKAGPGRARSMLVEVGRLILRGRNPATQALYLRASRIAVGRGLRRVQSLEALRGSHLLLDEAVALLDHVVQVFKTPQLTVLRHDSLSL